MMQGEVPGILNLWRTGRGTDGTGWGTDVTGGGTDCFVDNTLFLYASFDSEVPL